MYVVQDEYRKYSYIENEFYDHAMQPAHISHALSKE